MTPSKTLIIAYEPAQFADLWRAREQYPDATVVALDAEVEYELEERNIPCISGRDLRETDSLKYMTVTDHYVINILNAQTWKFFSYRDTPLGPLFTYLLQEYFNRMLYYVSLLERLHTAYPEAAWIVLPPPGLPPRAGGALAIANYHVVSRAAQLVAEMHDSKLIIQNHPPARYAGVSFAFERTFFSFALEVFSFMIRILQSRRTVRLLITDIWRNIGSVVGTMPDAEILLLDRSEIRNISWRTIWRHRMQFVHLAQYAGKDANRVATLRVLQEQWQHHAVVPRLQYKGIDVTVVVKEALDTIFEHALSAVLEQIDGAYGLFEQEPLTTVMLRTSVSGQTHFGVLALVAKRFNIPSIELQHGVEYFGPGSLSRNHLAGYIAVYGPFITREMMRIGYDATRLIEIGSPRFDAIVEHDTESKNATLCIGPDPYVGGGYDSYDCETYLKAFFAALPPGRTAIVKLRGGVREPFFRRAIKRVSEGRPCEIEKDRLLGDILPEVRGVVSCYSTSVLESIHAGVPTILWSASQGEVAMSEFHFTPYAEAGALLFARSPAEVKETLKNLESPEVYRQQRAAANAFFTKEFLFDGHATERFAAHIRELELVKNRELLR